MSGNDGSHEYTDTNGADAGDSAGTDDFTAETDDAGFSLALEAQKSPVANVTGWAEELGLQSATNSSTVNASAALSQEAPQRRKLWIYIGIFSQGDAQTSASGLRRQAIRNTWLPSVAQQRNMLARFVAGRPIKDSAIALFRDELNAKQDFLFLDFQECTDPDCSSRKLLAFFHKVTAAYEAAWIVKVDDAVYLAPQRLALGAQQWHAMHAEYVGCMKRGINIPEASHWQQKQQFDKDRMLLGYSHVMNAHEAAFVVAGSVVEEGLIPNTEHLRTFGSADTSMGMWMVSFKVNFFDDTRLCNPVCHPAAIAFLNTGCSGLCDPLSDMHYFHSLPLCTSPASAPLPYMDSFDFNRQFENMRQIL